VEGLLDSRAQLGVAGSGIRLWWRQQVDQPLVQAIVHR